MLDQQLAQCHCTATTGEPLHTRLNCCVLLYCLQLYMLTLSLVRIDVGALVSSSMAVYPLLTLLLIRTGVSDQCWQQASMGGSSYHVPTRVRDGLQIAVLSVG
jgi:hypothetical protein